jgi:hypothetical protein
MIVPPGPLNFEDIQAAPEAGLTDHLLESERHRQPVDRGMKQHPFQNLSKGLLVWNRLYSDVNFLS